MRPSTVVPGLALLVACATVPTQTKVMQEQGAKVSSEAIRMRMRAEAVPFTGLMEQAADEASAASPDPAVRRRSLVWKVNVVPAMYRTLFNQRPLVALLDTWALLMQAEQYLESPEGAAAFGPGVDTVLATTRDLDQRVQEIAQWAFPGKDLTPIRAKVQAWAEKHPVRLSFATRDSIENALVTLVPTEELSAFAVVGQINEDVSGLVSRMDFLPIMVPRQATWQAELAYVDLVEPQVDVALKRTREAMDKLDGVIAWMGTEGLDAFAEDQRVEIMRAVAAERIEIEKLVERQRLEIQAFVDREREEIAALVGRERAAAIADAQRLADHATAEAARSAKEVVDHATVRIAAVLGLGLVLWAVLSWFLRRRAPPARPPAA